jgi:DNA-binding MarR family transcriptional regulator
MHPARLKRPSRPSDDVRQVLDGIRCVVQSLRESSRAAESAVGVSGAQLFVLQVLAREPALCLSEVAQRTHTHQSSVSVVVGRLVAGGLVERRQSAEDGRRMELAITPAGRALLGDAPVAAQDRLVAALRKLPEKERRALARGLTALVAGMGLGDAAPEMFFEEAPRGKRRSTRDV